MPEDSLNYTPTNIEKVFELLDNKLVTFGAPGALSFVGITKARENQWTDAGLCFIGAASIWLAIKIGKKLAPKIDQVLDWSINMAEQSLLNTWAAFRSDFTRVYLQRQANLCEEAITEGFNPDNTAIPLLEEVFVPLDLSGAGVMEFGEHRKGNPLATETASKPDSLDIWRLLGRTRQDRKFKRMVILAKGGMGKTTLLRHIILIYAQEKYRRRGAPKLTPILLRLRNFAQTWKLETLPSLPQLITEIHLPKLFNHVSEKCPPAWAQKQLESGSVLVLLDGFDEVPENQRSKVSRWISKQMEDYKEAVFILTSRPAGYKDYTAQKPAVPIFINKFSEQQQESFIKRWYICQERCFRSRKQRKHADQVAENRAADLISQLRQRREELGEIAENPLLLNMLVTFHRLAPSTQLPRQRLELYQGICKLQLDDRPKARFIPMHLSFSKSMGILQKIALKMVKEQHITIAHSSLQEFLRHFPVWQQEQVSAEEWVKQVVEVSELLVEREKGEYEFPHLSFQGFFAANQLAIPQGAADGHPYTNLVLGNWNEAKWRETVLLYTAQLPPTRLQEVITKACEQDSEAAELAAVCLKEYPKPDKVDIHSLSAIIQDSKYQTLEELLKTQHWQEADQETYRLMITTVGKEDGQWFDADDLKTFPYEDLQILDHLWVKYSEGKWGFSVQKQIWEKCGSPRFFNSDWDKFGDCVGWRKKGKWLPIHQLTFDLNQITGELPTAHRRGEMYWRSELGVTNSLLARADL
ncbi:GUN4 domain-containing protein [Acaryochloris sp. IP29b_bin.148]|uniref:GUN4 domain-containing protein n=1 Tax=Acaryochloris sp. IP29b_bin.148 TaxID=2969218 RepID=UPI002617CEF3|nr:GUN4 domain-containing protein [Acaryochloris sp. IP29b_bin.148]